MSAKFSMDDYVDVAERIVVFKTAYPEGTLQTIDWRIETVGERTFIVYHAAAYRTPDDPRPSNGIAWEPFPGPTPYTRDSELMNAETAAWGRALVALGVLANRKIASKQEVRNRSAANDESKPPVALVTPADIKELVGASQGLEPAKIKLALAAAGLDGVTTWGQVPASKAPELVRALAGMERAA